jgi:PmbA protein
MKMTMNYDDLKSELLSLADTGLKHAQSEYDADFEIYLYWYNSAEAEIEQGIVSAKDGIVAGNAVRAAKGKKVGFACASGIEPERIDLSVKEAFEVADTAAVPDEEFEGFCEPEKPAKEGLADEAILELGVDDLIEHSESIVEEARSVDERAKVVGGSAEASWGGYAVVNSLGIEAATRSVSNYCVGQVIAIQNGERKSAYDFDGARERVFETEGVGKNAAQSAVDQLGAEKLDETTTLPTIWAPRAAAAYLLSSIGKATLGRPVVEGISPLCDMIGDTIASEDFTLIDDGQKPTGMGTEAIDAEGYPQQKNVIIEDGVLKSFLFDTYYGRQFGSGSTGNSSRGGGIFGGTTPYESPPSISMKFLDVAPGKGSHEDIISSFDGKAILITEPPIGMFHTNVSTGEFSVVANNVYLVEDGERKCPLKSTSVSGKFYEGLANLIRIGEDKTLVPYGAEVPTLAFDGFSIVG